MPRQNRVTPFGKIIATPERGTLMGNRGLLHDGDGQIRRDWRLKRWIHCVLEFKGRHRQVMTPGRYTELFFLDEATALAAGHRPCAECLCSRYNDFRAAWIAGNPRLIGSDRVSAELIDDVLHADRMEANGSKHLFAAELDRLPDGVFVSVEARPDQAFLIQGQSLLAWSPGGYVERLARGEATSFGADPAIDGGCDPRRIRAGGSCDGEPGLTGIKVDIDKSGEPNDNHSRPIRVLGLHRRAGQLHSYRFQCYRHRAQGNNAVTYAGTTRAAQNEAIGRDGYARVDAFVVLAAEDYDRLRAVLDDGSDMARVGALVDSAMKEEDADDPLLESYQRYRP